MGLSEECDDVKAYLISALLNQPKSEALRKLKAKKCSTKAEVETTKEGLEEKKKLTPASSPAVGRTTSDGFKIVSESDLLQDDSDISDAFESADSDCEDDVDERIPSCSNEQYTDDGFKIVSSLPEDDLDVSDAFCEEASDEEQDNELFAKLESSSKQAAAGKSDNTGKKNIINTGTVDKSSSNLSNGFSISGVSLPKSHNNSSNGLNISGKKRKRGSKKRKQSDPGNINAPIITPARNKKKKEVQNLSAEDIEIIKSRYAPHVHKMVEKLGLNWADLESKKMREKRELSKLPQPAPIPNCQVYLKKCPGTNKVLTVYDYSEKRKSIPSLSEEKPLKKKKSKSDKPSEISGKEKNESMTPEEEAKLKQRREMKKEHLEELRSIKRRLNSQVVNKVLDPATRTQNMLAKIEKLGGSKVKKPMVNYKTYMVQKVSEKLAEEEKRQNLRDVGMRDLVKKKRRARKKRDANDVPGWGSLGGRFSREGVRVVRKGEKVTVDRT
ncbi:Protein of unknown function DUF4602 [Trinorchestia longiramus]|nr:Protein of unknown function DUF4602 [Trinorchestia longiramus]